MSRRRSREIHHYFLENVILDFGAGFAKKEVRFPTLSHVIKHAIKFPSEEFALSLGVALPFGHPWPLRLREGFLT